MRALIIASILATVTVWAGSIDGNEFVDGQVIIKFKDHVIRQSADLPGVEDEAILVQNLDVAGAGLYAVQDVDLPRLLARLNADPRIAYAEPNWIYRVDPIVSDDPVHIEGRAEANPNDPMYNDLYGMKNTGQTGGKAGADIKAYKAWEQSTGSRNVLVAIIDTGVDYTHEDLTDNIWTNPGESGNDASGKDKRTNGVDDDGNGFIDDWHGWDFANKDNDPKDDHSHGTHCAGTIGGVGDNGKGVVGVNWKVGILPIKFLKGNGSGTLADAVLSIDYATKMKAHLMSNSWGGGGFTKTMEDSIIAASKAGILFVAAAGNNSSDNDKKPHYPSSYETENVLAVAAVDHNAGIASFSCYGLTSVDVGAPGVDILSSVTGNTYKKFSGTSMATPHVAGAAALIWSVLPQLSHLDVKARLMNTAVGISALAGKTVTGGMIDVASAMEVDDVAPSAVTDLKVAGTDLTAIDLEWSAAGDDNTTGAAAAYIVKYADQPIVNENDWNKANLGLVLASSAVYGSKMKVRVGNLGVTKTYYFALKARDNVNNLSILSNSVSGTTANVMKLFADDMENNQSGNWYAVGGWVPSAKEKHSGTTSMGLEVSSREAVLAFLDSAPIDLGGSKSAFFSFWHKYTMDAYGARGIVFVSDNGGKTWNQVLEVRGSSDWKSEFIDLTPFLKGGAKLMLKFAHMSTTKPIPLTWYLDDVVIFVKEQ